MENTTDHLDEFSLFSYVNIPGGFDLGPSILEWIEKEPKAQYRLIIDDDADYDFLSFDAIQDLYPGVTSIATITNPWRRLVLIYNVLKISKENNDISDIIANIDFSNFTFESFLSQLDTNINRWFTISTPQSRWIDNRTELLYIIRDEYIEEDIKPLRDYFKNSDPILFELIPYREYYTDKTKEFVEKLFKEDIEKFNYKF